MSESFAALFEESLQRSEMRAGEVITAEVVRIEHNFVVVNAGNKEQDFEFLKNNLQGKASLMRLDSRALGELLVRAEALMERPLHLTA